MATPYEEQQVVEFATQCDALLHPDSGRVGVNCARMQYDASTPTSQWPNGMGYPASRAKHLAELKAELGIPPTPIPPGVLIPAPREYNGNMCGIRVAGLPAIPGGQTADPSLVLSWFYDRYAPADRARIRRAWLDRGEPDVLLSWPDSRAFGFDAHAFITTCLELIADGLRPCVMLCSKDIDPHDLAGIQANIDLVYPALLSSACAPRICIGWELSIWLSPADVQALIDRYGPPAFQRGVLTYVHFQEGYFAFEVDKPGAVTADFWNLQAGKLTGVLHQRKLEWGREEYQARIVDCLLRFAGYFGFIHDCGAGHPFDFIALEITAMNQFNDGMSEAEGNTWGRTALTTPAQSGPAGVVAVMGSGNGS